MSGDLLSGFFEWLTLNLDKLLFSIVVIAIIYVVYRVISSQIVRLRQQQKLEANIALIITRIFQWIAALAVLLVVLNLFGIEVGLIAGLLTLAGGTIVGFAAMNTLGNAIAGIIVMTSAPFKIGDRIYFNGKFADVVSIDLIYTRMRTLDNVLVSVPNQELLKAEIDNYGKKRLVRRKCAITVGYEVDPEFVEKVLLEAAAKVKGVLKNPKPYVWVTDFKDYAAEYTLCVYIDNVKQLAEIQAELMRTVLKACEENGVDIATPLLVRSVG